MSYADLVSAQRRLFELQMLANADSYLASIDLLYTALPATGHAVSMSQLRLDLDHMQSIGLVDYETMGGIIMVRLLQRGLDAQSGLQTVPGIARPLPKLI